MSRLFKDYIAEIVGSGTGSIGGAVTASGDKGAGSDVAQYWSKIGIGTVRRQYPKLTFNNYNKKKKKK